MQQRQEVREKDVCEEEQRVSLGWKTGEMKLETHYRKYITNEPSSWTSGSIYSPSRNHKAKT